MNPKTPTMSAVQNSEARVAGGGRHSGAAGAVRPAWSCGCAHGEVAVRVLFAFPGVRGWVGGGAASKSWALEKNSRLFLSSLLSRHQRTQPGKFICNRLYEEIYFTSDHAHIHESPLVVITLQLNGDITLFSIIFTSWRDPRGVLMTWEHE